MSRSLRTPTVIVLVAIAALTVAAFVGLKAPWVAGVEAPSPSAQMNAENARKIIDSPHMRSFALPVDQPLGLEFLTTVRTTSSAFEMVVQHHGFLYALCDANADPESTCDTPDAQLIREEAVGGRTVRIARMAPGVDAPKITHDPTEAELDEALEYWQSIELVRGGTPAWITALGQEEQGTNTGNEDK